MHERMPDKDSAPTPDDIARTIGADALIRLEKLESWLSAHYDLTRSLKFPFGSAYGWGYKYSHKTAHLCYAFFETGAFTVTIQIGDAQAASLQANLPLMQPETQRLWSHRYPCGQNGGWLHIRISDDIMLDDVCDLITIRKPITKRK